MLVKLIGGMRMVAIKGLLSVVVPVTEMASSNSEVSRKELEKVLHKALSGQIDDSLIESIVVGAVKHNTVEALVYLTGQLKTDTVRAPRELMVI